MGIDIGILFETKKIYLDIVRELLSDKTQRFEIVGAGISDNSKEKYTFYTDSKQGYKSIYDLSLPYILPLEKINNYLNKDNASIGLNFFISNKKFIQLFGLSLDKTKGHIRLMFEEFRMTNDKEKVVNTVDLLSEFIQPDAIYNVLEEYDLKEIKKKYGRNHFELWTDLRNRENICKRIDKIVEKYQYEKNKP